MTLLLIALVGCGYVEDDLSPELEPGSGNQSSITDGDTIDNDDDSSDSLPTSPEEDDIPSEPCLEGCDEPDGNVEEKNEITRSEIPAALMNEIDRKLQASRYMAKNCFKSEYPGYEGLPVERCSYTMRDGAKGEVFMLNADSLQIAAWIKDSCEFINKDVTSCGLKLFKSVLFASGGQFAVAGMVYEDLNGNGKSESFAFRHGVTVKISSFGTGSERKISNSQMQDALWASPVSTYRYARIVSTTREQYYAYMNKIGVEAIDVGTSATGKRKNSWMSVIKYLYTSSWGKRANPLMRAWANSNKSRL